MNLRLGDQEGSVMVIVFVAMVVLTIIGIAAINNTNVELQVSRNERLNKTVFFTAEAARGYVAGNPVLYSSQNIDAGSPMRFPLQADDPDQDGSFLLENGLSFSGTVQYVPSNVPRVVPRGSGFGYGTYQPHRYIMQCTGNGPDNSERKIEQGFYRIGF